ncbi:MAG: hypothetical protein PHR03_06515 [Desulfovibrionales bacterium]|nr:hypothetical protein [Desulfovibrionales bacterium]
MSAGLPEDVVNTVAQMQSPTPMPPVGSNWLRHGVTTQACLIDSMLLGEGHMLDEIAHELYRVFQVDHPDRQPADWIPRIQSHLGHLTDGDPTYQEPHHLSVVEVGGRWRFGYF